MKKIFLTRNKVALVDDDDYEWLNKYKWYAWKSKKKWYARRTGRESDGDYFRKAITMHRQILGLYDTYLQGDHKDNDGLNNQKYNLRICTNLQNVKNKPKSKSKKYTSKYKGVHLKVYKSGYRTWIAQIIGENRKIHIGCFRTQKEASKAYDVAALKYHGDFANINKA